MHRFILSLLLLTTPALAEFVPKPLIVHEWGTFTSLQDETGRSIGYLNSSDEPLPKFVHRLSQGLLIHDNPFSKGIGEAHPDVTMRLETPVIYFHPADPHAPPFSVDVTATFKGGVLSEFYPNATAQIDGAAPTPAALDHFSPETTVGTLTWKNVRVGGEVKIPPTPEHVWTAPRKVDSAPVSVGNEGEQYLFYRGVASLASPLKVRRMGDEIIVSESGPMGYIKWGNMWLAEFRENGSCAYRTITAEPARAADAFSPQPATFKNDAFSKQRVADLRKEMRASLIAAGLFDDEAEAMLSTWERAYFTGVGQRLFFLVPQKWTDQVLPLTISTPHELKRVMVGRVELVTPQQQKALAKLPDPDALKCLGRFWYAMILDQLKQHPDPALAKIANTWDVHERTPSTRPSGNEGAVKVSAFSR